MVHGSGSLGKWLPVWAQPERASGIDAEKHDQGEDHEFGVKQDENAGVVEAPFWAEAAGCFDHAPGSDADYEKLPEGAVEFADVRESSEAQADGEGCQRECQAADERALTKAEDGSAGKHRCRDCRRDWQGIPLISPPVPSP